MDEGVIAPADLEEFIAIDMLSETSNVMMAPNNMYNCRISRLTSVNASAKLKQ